MFTLIERLFKLGLVNFWRNRWLSLMATIIMTLTLFTISVFLILNAVATQTTQRVKEKIDLIVYFHDSATDEQIAVLKNLLTVRPDVKLVEYISKEQALALFQQRSIKENIKNLVTLENNPLPRSLQVKATDPNFLDDIANFINTDPYKPIIRSLSYQQNRDIIKRLINITSFVKQFGLGLSLIFILISIFTIINTIRLTIFHRKEEIEIMKLVGATDTYVRVPFLLEGMLYGLLAGIISIILVALVIKLITPSIVLYLGDIGFNIRTFFQTHLFEIFLLQLLIGILIGTISSYFSVRRHLRV